MLPQGFRRRKLATLRRYRPTSELLYVIRGVVRYQFLYTFAHGRQLGLVVLVDPVVCPRLLVEQDVRRVGRFQALEVLERGLGHETVVKFVPALLGVAGVREVVPVIHTVSGMHDSGVQVVRLGHGVRYRRHRQLYGVVVHYLVPKFRP